jgi:uncharacterized protein (DUF58 family)
MHSKILTLPLVVVGLLLAALAARSGDIAWLALPFLAYLALGILQSPIASKVRLSASRSLEVKREAGITTVEVSVRITNQGPEIDLLCLSDELQPGMSLTEGQIHQVVALRPGEETLLKYTFKSERGNFDWKDVQAAASDPLGLLMTPVEAPAEARVQIQPALTHYKPFLLRPQATLHSAGSIPAHLGGSGTDFWGVRGYRPGDSLRRLDWRLTARHPQQFFTKEFEQEEIADIGLILDARYRTNLKLGDESLFEHSARAAASLAEVFLQQGNRLSMLIYGQNDDILYPGYGKVQLYRILNALAKVKIEPDDKLDSLQLAPLHVFSSKSLVLVFSPLANNDWLLFPRLRAHGFQVLLVSPDPLDFALRALPTDPLSGMAARLAQVERRMEIGRIAQLWIPVIDWQVSQPLSPLVRNALLHTHIQQQR